jgi:hypothetical protein
MPFNSTSPHDSGEFPGQCHDKARWTQATRSTEDKEQGLPNGRRDKMIRGLPTQTHRSKRMLNLSHPHPSGWLHLTNPSDAIHPDASGHEATRGLSFDTNR